MRIGYRIKYSKSLIEELQHHQKQLLELEPVLSEKNKHLFEDLEVGNRIFCLTFPGEKVSTHFAGRKIKYFEEEF